MYLLIPRQRGGAQRKESPAAVRDHTIPSVTPAGQEAATTEILKLHSEEEFTFYNNSDLTGNYEETCP